MRSITPRRADGVFRMPLDRAFSAKGFGTVVAGIPIAGSASLGGETVLLPQNFTSRIKRIEVYGQPGDTVLCGQCAAINLGHCDAKEIRRGDVLTLPGYFTPQEFYVCRLRLLPLEKISLKSGAELKFHTGTSEVNATLYLLESGELRRHRWSSCSIRPVPHEAADRGGAGRPVSSCGVFRPSARSAAARSSRPSSDGSNAIGRASRKTWPCGPRRSATTPDSWNTPSARPRRSAIAKADLARRTKTLYPQAGRDLVRPCARAESALSLAAELYLHRATAAEAGEQAPGPACRVSPPCPGKPGHDLGAAPGEACPWQKPVLEGLVRLLKADGRLVETISVWRGPNIGRPFKIATPPCMEAIESCFRQQEFAPPSAAELAEKIKIPPAAIDKLLRILQEHQRLVAVGEGLLFHREAVDRARQPAGRAHSEGRAAGERAIQVSAGHDAEVRPAAVGLFRSQRLASPGGQHARI